MAFLGRDILGWHGPFPTHGVSLIFYLRGFLYHGNEIKDTHLKVDFLPMDYYFDFSACVNNSNTGAYIRMGCNTNLTKSHDFIVRAM